MNEDNPYAHEHEPHFTRMSDIIWNTFHIIRHYSESIIKALEKWDNEKAKEMATKLKAVIKEKDELYVEQLVKRPPEYMIEEEKEEVKEKTEIILTDIQWVSDSEKETECVNSDHCGYYIWLKN